MVLSPVIGDALATGLFVFISSIWEEVRDHSWLYDTLSPADRHPKKATMEVS